MFSLSPKTESTSDKGQGPTEIGMVKKQLGNGCLNGSWFGWSKEWDGRHELKSPINGQKV